MKNQRLQKLEVINNQDFGPDLLKICFCTQLTKTISWAPVMNAHKPKAQQPDHTIAIAEQQDTIRHLELLLGI